MIRALGVALALLATLTSVQAQTFRPGFGFARPGFQFLSAGPQLWTPVQLGSALVAWWDASDTDNITLSGSSVASWRDKVGGITLAQGTASARPTWSAAARFSKPGVTFLRASSQTLTGAASTLPLGANPSTIAVAGFTNLNATNSTFFSYGTNGGGLQRIVGHSNTTANNVWVSVNNSNYQPAVAWVGADRFVSWSLAPGTSNTVFVDSVELTGAVFGANTSGTAVQMGSLVGNGTTYVNGIIQQVLVMNRVLTTAEQQKLDGWESWADGKAGANLPAGHPFKSRAPLTTDP